ncbi:unnamed protein product [Blepharisma stoltei]|uniref:Palmitoyl-protein thioesterase 1 n=1 Tax=Blepharisma stoltei TaxID=1481888 RepID=A0AAU9K131_9CILI|nr:unnamed protein product [Blepharisma stoltei]
MKAVLFLCALSFVLSEKTLNNQFLTGVLEGADLISKVDALTCNYSPSDDDQENKFTSAWEKFVVDLVDITVNCKFEYALRPITNLRTSEKMMAKAQQKFEDAKAKGQFPVLSDINMYGKILGAWLTEFMRMASPSAFKFSYESPSIVALADSSALPILFFHGINGACTDSNYVEFGDYLREQLGTYVSCIEIGNGAQSSILMSMTDQVNEACTKVKADPNYQGSFNLIGISQGGIVARGVFQHCSGLQVNNLITIGSPVMGVNKFPSCEFGIKCSIYNNAARLGAYSSAFQALGPGGYVKDQYQYQTYLKKSSFLADLNNERSINQDYIDLYLSLGYFVQFFFTQDTIVIPKQSEWFGYFKENSEIMQAYNETLDYVNNYLGAQNMDAEGKIIRTLIEAGHCDLTHEQVNQYLIPYLQ